VVHQQQDKNPWSIISPVTTYIHASEDNLIRYNYLPFLLEDFSVLELEEPMLLVVSCAVLVCDTESANQPQDFYQLVCFGSYISIY
jgi:hypothetical protein